MESVPAKPAGKDRELFVDAARIIATFLVIVNHTNSDIFLTRPVSVTWFVSLTWFFVSKLAVPVFLLISGVTLLPKTYSYRKTFLRILKLFAVLCLFSAVYYLYYHFDRTAGRFADGTSFAGYADALKASPTNSYWYLYMYLGILLMLPLLQRLAGAMSRRDVRYLLIVSIGILSSIPVLRVWCPDVWYSSYLELPLFSVYLGILFAGYYIHRYTRPGKGPALLAAVTLVGGIALEVVLTRSLYRKYGGSNYLRIDGNGNLITMILPAMAFFYLLRHYFDRLPLPKWLQSLTVRLGKLSFCAYLLGDLAIQELRFVYTDLSAHMHVMPAMLLYELLCAAVCYGGSFLLSLVPGLRKLLR